MHNPHIKNLKQQNNQHDSRPVDSSDRGECKSTSDPEVETVVREDSVGSMKAHDRSKDGRPVDSGERG